MKICCKLFSSLILLLLVVSPDSSLLAQNTVGVKDKNRAFLSGEWTPVRIRFESDDIQNPEASIDREMISIFADVLLPKIKMHYFINGKFKKDTLTESDPVTYSNAESGSYRLEMRKDTLCIVRKSETEKTERVKFLSDDTLILYGRNRNAADLPFINLPAKEKSAKTIRANLVLAKTKASPLELLLEKIKKPVSSADLIKKYLPGAWKAVSMHKRKVYSSSSFSELSVIDLDEKPEQRPWFLFNADNTLFFDRKNKFSLSGQNQVKVKYRNHPSKKFREHTFTIYAINENSLCLSFIAEPEEVLSAASLISSPLIASLKESGVKKMEFFLDLQRENSTVNPMWERVEIPEDEREGYRLLGAGTSDLYFSKKVETGFKYRTFNLAGKKWSTLDFPLEGNTEIQQFASEGSRLILQTENGVQVRDPGSVMWKNIQAMRPDTMCRGRENKLVFYGNELICTNGKNLYSSLDFGKTWKLQGKESDSIITIRKFASAGRKRIICGEKIRYVYSPVYSDDGVSVVSYQKNPENHSFAAISSDSGKTWTDVSSRFDKMFGAEEAGVTDSIFLLQWGSTFYTSSDNGFTWKEYSSAEIQLIGSDFLYQLSSMFSTMMSFMFGNFSKDLSIKIDLGCGNVSGFSIPEYGKSDEVYQQDKHLLIRQNTGISYSAGPGKKWYEVSNSALQRGVSSLAFSKEYLYATSACYGIWRIKLSDLEKLIHSAP